MHTVIRASIVDASTRTEVPTLRHMELSELAAEITRLAAGSVVGSRMHEVVVEANDDLDGGEFLRVILKMTDMKGLKIEEVGPLVRSIEEALALKDERFASVRLVDAA